MNDLKPNNRPGPLQLALFVEEIDYILSALSKMPFDQVHLLVAKIRSQALSQLHPQEQQQAAPAAPPIDIH